MSSNSTPSWLVPALRRHPLYDKVVGTMRLYRAAIPLLLALFLLLSQQGGVTHALHHTLADNSQQQDQGKHAPHSSACGYCAAYTQLDSALGSVVHSFVVTVLPNGPVHFSKLAFFSNQPLLAVARGPPRLLQEIA
ncbi:MAG: DUF2946 family protein [Candidatus Nitrotoga sp.]